MVHRPLHPWEQPSRQEPWLNGPQRLDNISRRSTQKHSAWSRPGWRKTVILRTPQWRWNQDVYISLQELQTNKHARRSKVKCWHGKVELQPAGVPQWNQFRVTSMMEWCGPRPCLAILSLLLGLKQKWKMTPRALRVHLHHFNGAIIMKLSNIIFKRLGEGKKEFHFLLL